MRLSDRLETVIGTVNPAGCAADIGTDHGFVPVELVRRNRVKRALAMDVRPGPLSRAKEHIVQAGLSGQIETRLSDGLEKLKPGEADAVVIAGMGGELMIRILEQGKELFGTVGQWVFSPHSELPKFRKWLWENGFSIKKEAMVFEDGKYYTVIDAVFGGERLDDGREAGENQEAENGWEAGENQGAEGGRKFRYSPYLIEKKDPVFLGFLKDEEEKLMTLCERLAPQAKTSDRAAEGLLDARERLSYNREVQHEMQ